MFSTLTEANCWWCGRTYPVKIVTEAFSRFKTFKATVQAAEHHLWIDYLRKSNWSKHKGRLCCNVCTRKKRWLKETNRGQ